MTKKLFLFSAVFFTVIFAKSQNIAITDIFFTPIGGQPADRIHPDSLNPGDTLTLWFIATNNLNDDLLANDSITFGWSVDGQDRGTLIQSQRSQTWATGSSVNSFLTNSYVLPASGNFEICTWPLYNPYTPNTDPTAFRYCGDFSIKSAPPVNVANIQNNEMQVFSNNGKIFIENGEGLVNIQIFDITGKIVDQNQQNLNIGNISTIDLSHLKSGIYIFRALADNQLIKTQKLVLN